MQVSFIIPLFNCLEFTRECLRTLQATLPADLAHEIILVDDGSTDGTREWLATLAAPFRVILNERNLGYAAANNRGAKQAQGKQLVLLNNDLVFEDGWFEPMLDVHHRLGPQAGCVGNIQLVVKTGRVDHAGIRINHRGKPEHETTGRPWPWQKRLVPAVTGACLMIARSCYLDVCGFDEGFRNGGEDVDLCFRLTAQGRRHAVALRSRVWHHVSASPSRKLHDEANSRRLAERYLTRLCLLGARAWAQHQLETTWAGSRDPVGWPTALRLLVNALGIGTPSAVALAGISSAMEEEMARWRQLDIGGARSLPAQVTVDYLAND
jgi:GT2 family glycosyltransferase